MRVLRKSLLAILIVFSCMVVNAQIEQVPFVIHGTGAYHSNYRMLKIGDREVYHAGGRGLRLTILLKTDYSIVSDQEFDTYGSTIACDNLATKLNALNKGQIGVLTSYDAWELNLSDNLITAFMRLGLTKAAVTEKTCRRPYAAIFEGATAGEESSKAVEVSFMNTPNQPFAEIRGYLSEGSFVASGTSPNALSRPQGDGAELIVDYRGNVGVGTIKPKHKFEVAGTIRAKEIKVDSNDWPDYVFEEDYKLKSLEEVEQFVKVHKHLPGIVPAKKVEQEGVALAEMNKLLLQKVEELTLYSITLSKENQELKGKVASQKEDIKSIEMKLQKLIKVVNAKPQKEEY
ncbi:hypothetical protein EYV94_21620 [Puteibacter caeruleilacunae]|nr:hypothetical protein EYV94_21620 [Puteibacter caeruleilacunae]